MADVLNAFGKGKIVNAIGNSMAGLLAILATKFLNVITDCFAGRSAQEIISSHLQNPDYSVYPAQKRIGRLYGC
jgi:hypothetical protein